VLLEVNHLVKLYQGKHKTAVPAVQGVTFGVDAGEIFAFLGPNGAGKTTTIKMIAGLVEPDEGDVTIMGASVQHQRQQALREIGAVLEGSRNLYWRLNPLENIEYWAGIRGIPHTAARKRGLELLCDFGLEKKLDSTVQKLSRGMQQLVAVCAALIHSPKLLLLDEPTLGLDLDASDKIQALITSLARDRGVAILLTTHQMEVAQALSHRVGIMNEGKLVTVGNTQETLQAFGRNVYQFVCTGAINSVIRAELIAQGADFADDTKFTIELTDPAETYEIIDKLKPLPIVKIERDVADLATVFRHYTQGGTVS